jgi:hypothetical protein
MHKSQLPYNYLGGVQAELLEVSQISLVDILLFI